MQVRALVEGLPVRLASLLGGSMVRGMGWPDSGPSAMEWMRRVGGAAPSLHCRGSGTNRFVKSLASPWGLNRVPRAPKRSDIGRLQSSLREAPSHRLAQLERPFGQRIADEVDGDRALLQHGVVEVLVGP